MGMGVFKLHTPTLKSMPLYIGELLRTPTQNVSHVYRRTFAYPYAKCPMYTGEILRTPTQNVSHVYRRSFVYPYAKYLPCI